MGDPLVTLEDLSVRVGPTPILVDVHLRLEPGEVVGVAGPNGAGKSTLLGVVATMVRPTGGWGRVLGADLGTETARTVRRRIGWSGHDPGLYPELTLAQNLRFAAAVAGLPPEAALRALAEVGLAAAGDRRADRCSNGMQRRADLARLLMLRPDLVLLDEPRSGLDAEAQVIVDEVLERVRAAGGGGLLVSHDADAVRPHVDRVVRMEMGRVWP